MSEAAMIDDKRLQARRNARRLAGALLLVVLAVGGVFAFRHYRDVRERQDDLDRVPADAFAFVTIRVADYWNSPGGVHVRASLDKLDPQALDKMQRELGLLPGDIERVTLIVPRFETWDKDWYGFVVTRTTLDGDRIGSAFGQTAQERKHEDHTYYVRQQLAYYFMSYRQVLVGTEAGVQRALTTEPAREGPLKSAVGLAQTGKHHIIACIQPPRDRIDAYRATLPFWYRAVDPLLDLQSATLLAQDNDGLDLRAHVYFENADKAKAAKDVFEMVRIYGRGMLPELKKSLPPQLPADMGNILAAATTSLEKLKLEVQGTAVHIPFHLHGESNRLGAIVALLVPMVTGDLK